MFCSLHVCRIGTGNGVKYRGQGRRTAKVTFDDGWIQIPPLSVYTKSVLARQVRRCVACRKVCVYESFSVNMDCFKSRDFTVAPLCPLVFMIACLGFVSFRKVTFRVSLILLVVYIII